MEEIKLYDQEKRERPIGLGKGWHHFRSKRAYKCGICGCLSNEFRMVIGYPGFPPTLCCPGAKANQGLHSLLWTKSRKAVDESYPKSFREELDAEIGELREQFQYILPNIEGSVEEWEGAEPKQLIGQ